ncbi:MAG: hypothetical protein K6A28_06830 [Bacteroidales bacterium]|nr:hypothetical protein [Bacteroidales bacterium]
MKKSTLLIIGILVGSAAGLSSCDNGTATGLVNAIQQSGVLDESNNNQGKNKDRYASLLSEKPQASQVNGNTMTYGDHVYTVDGYIGDREGEVIGHRGTPTATVTFTNVPSGFEEFSTVYSQFLGKSIQGTAAMIPMAIEIYARDKDTGKRCFDLLCNSSSTVASITRILDTKLVPSQYSEPNDPYLQRYMAAALLKGAVNKNAYQPVEPYTVEMCASVNKPQEVTDGIDTFVYILAKGWDSEQRQVEIFQPYGSELYKVYNCPSCYTQCKNIIGTWAGLK